MYMLQTNPGRSPLHYILGCCLYRTYAVSVPGSCCDTFCLSVHFLSSAPRYGHLTVWGEVYTEGDTSVSLVASFWEATVHTQTLKLCGQLVFLHGVLCPSSLPPKDFSSQRLRDLWSGCPIEDRVVGPLQYHTLSQAHAYFLCISGEHLSH